MAFRSITHVALRVTSLPEAERQYRSLFGMEVAYREAETPDGWRTLPDELDWSDAVSKGVSPGMTVLHRDGFRLALEATDAVPPSGVLDHIGLLAEETDLAAIRSLAHEVGSIVVDAPSLLIVEDAFGIRWEISTAIQEDPRDESHGARSGLWLDAPH